MIVQTAPEGAAHFVITQRDHARTSGQLAKAFGNDHFALLAPKALMEYVIAHHDEGWDSVDSSPTLDPNTRLPYHLTQTPLPQLLISGRESPTFNEKHHPYCGLISSMHTWGLYHGRYGLSDKIFINIIPSQHKAAVEEMLNGETARQERLKAQLAANGEMAEWIEDVFLFHNYKLLQFFDTLALYFQTVCEAQLTESHFHNVPAALAKDITIKARPIKKGVIGLTPYPFQADELEVYTEGRYLTTLPEDTTTDLANMMRTTPITRQTFKLVAG